MAGVMCYTMTMKRNTLHWLAGFLEGEGSFLAGSPSYPTKPSIRFTTTDKDVAEKVANLWGKSVIVCKPRQVHHKIPYVSVMSGLASVHLMKRLRPLMSLRRKEQIDRAIACYQRLGPQSLNAQTINRIKKYLYAGKLIQREIAALCGVSRETVCRIHTGWRDTRV